MFKVNGPGCCGCSPCSLASCDEGTLIGWDVEIKGFPATRIWYTNTGFVERRFTATGFDAFNAIYNIRDANEDCLAEDQTVDANCTIVYEANFIGGLSPCNCTYDPPYSCTWPMRLTVGFPGMTVVSLWNGLDAICAGGTGGPNTDQPPWLVSLSHASPTPCVYQSSSVTLNFDPCSNCGDATSVTITMNSTPVFL